MKIEDLIMKKLKENPDFQDFLDKSDEIIKQAWPKIEVSLLLFKNFMTEIGELFVKFLTISEEMAKRYPKLKNIEIPMAEKSWFISGYFDNAEMLQLASLCDDFTEDELSNYIENMYRSSLKEHTAFLVKDYQERGTAIQLASDAHNRGEYALSIPVFFAQADGIFMDKTGYNIFHKYNCFSKEKDFVNKIESLRDHNNPYARYDWMSVYSEIMYMGFPKKNLSKVLELRSKVMHGNDLYYATETNSLKAFSLLSRIATLQKDINDPNDAFFYSH